MKTKIKKPIIISCMALFAFGAFWGLFALNQNSSPSNAEEWRAELFILPEKGTYITNEDFSVTINVNTNMEINAADAKIQFLPDKLEVKNLSKDGSIFDFWPLEPTYSNTSGAIQFGGGLPTPGFKGSKGQILTIVFKSKEEGKVDVEFEEGSVLANDGKGTDILKEQKGATFVLITSNASDFNNDGQTNLRDLSILLSSWGIPKNPKADINQDGKVDIADFSILLSNF